MSRDAARAANRARFPELAAAMDLLPAGARLVYAEDAAGSIGKKPELEPHLFEVSVETLTHMRQVEALRSKRK